MRVADTTHASQRTANIAQPSQQRRKNPGARCPRLAESNLGELPLRILSGYGSSHRVCELELLRKRPPLGGEGGLLGGVGALEPQTHLTP